MKNVKWIIGGVALVAVATTATLSMTSTGAEARTVTVYKSPTCGCCSKWVDHLEDNGFTVETVEMNDVTPIKRRLGITAENASCHTAIIDGYIVEGHVPAEVIDRLLAERPAGVAGLAVPGMPMGSPGMEGPYQDRYNVFALDSAGTRSVYASR